MTHVDKPEMNIWRKETLAIQYSTHTRFKEKHILFKVYIKFTKSELSS